METLREHGGIVPPPSSLDTLFHLSCAYYLQEERMRKALCWPRTDLCVLSFLNNTQIDPATGAAPRHLWAWKTADHSCSVKLLRPNRDASYNPTRQPAIPCDTRRALDLLAACLLVFFNAFEEVDPVSWLGWNLFDYREVDILYRDPMRKELERVHGEILAKTIAVFADPDKCAPRISPFVATRMP